MVFNTYKQLSKSEIKILPLLRPRPANLRAQPSGLHRHRGMWSFYLLAPQSELRPCVVEAVMQTAPMLPKGRLTVELAVGCPSANNTGYRVSLLSMESNRKLSCMMIPFKRLHGSLSFCRIQKERFF